MSSSETKSIHWATCIKKKQQLEIQLYFVFEPVLVNIPDKDGAPQSYIFVPNPFRTIQIANIASFYLATCAKAKSRGTTADNTGESHLFVAQIGFFDRVLINAPQSKYKKHWL